MVILIKLIQAILLGIVMLFSLMLFTIATLAFIAFISDQLGLKELAYQLTKIQKNIWWNTRRWFFRYKGPGPAKKDD